MKQYKIKLLVFGGRHFNDYEYLTKVLDFNLQNYNKDEILIIQGDAKGADSLGRRYAIDNGIDHEDYPALWDNLDVEHCVVKYNKLGRAYNALAGHNRNKTMGDEATHGIGFWDNRSTGTLNMKNYLTKLGKPHKMFLY